MTAQSGNRQRYAANVELPQPLGTVTLIVSDEGVHALHLRAKTTNLPAPKGPAREVLARATKALRAYCRDGALPEIPALASAGTPFFERIWSELRKVPAGRTLSYGELATLAGAPRAARAVGMAMARNPLPIFTPCHRVLASGGGLGGFTGGLDTKRRLLEHEGKACRPSAQA